jgi:hypothetical protein
MPGGWKTFSGQSRHIHQPFSHQLLIPLQGISVLAQGESCSRSCSTPALRLEFRL